MEPVTHVLTGVCLARCGLNRRAAYATATMAIAAELPDIDTLWSLRGPVESFQHHRGITHTFLGLPFEAALLVGGVFLWHRWRSRHPGHPPSARKTPATGVAPVRWGVLYGCALLALLSHLWLDYTNNYGLRPFFPFDRHWYAGSFVFIFDPWIFLLLLAALLLPPLFGLVGTEVGVRRPAFRGRGWAIAALLGIVGWWGLRAWEHGRALRLAEAQTFAQTFAQTVPQTVPLDASQTGIQTATATASDPTTPPTPAPADPVLYLTTQRVLASPGLWSPWHWSAVMDYGPLLQLGDVQLDAFASTPGTLTPLPGTYARPSNSPAVQAAERTRLGRAYLDWSSLPILTESAGPDPGQTLVTFADPRFLSSPMGGRTALEGTVTLDARNAVLEETMDGRREPR